MLRVSCRVPQGTILGPLLFNVYVHDLFKIAIRGQVTHFADDTAIEITVQIYSICVFIGSI